jgi:hypothetical protein
MIIEKKIKLSSHSVQVAFLNPAQVESENFFLVFLPIVLFMEVKSRTHLGIYLKLWFRRWAKKDWRLIKTVWLRVVFPQTA